MKLTLDQFAQFDRLGHLFFPSHCMPEATKNLTDAVPELYALRENYNVREKGKDAVHPNCAAHLYGMPFAKLARHPRMIELVESLPGEKCCMRQLQINVKTAFEGDVWQWHQHDGAWLNDDHMLTEWAMSNAIFVRDVTGHNGPLMATAR